MADPGPDILVEQQRLRKQKLDQLSRIEGYKLDMVEADSRKRQALANLKAAEEAIKKVEKDLAAMVKAHGESVVDVEKVKKEMGDV